MHLHYFSRSGHNETFTGWLFILMQQKKTEPVLVYAVLPTMLLTSYNGKL